MILLILFHLGDFRNLKSFYKDYVQVHMKNEFSETVSYNRFVELRRKVSIPLAIFIKTIPYRQENVRASLLLTPHLFAHATLKEKSSIKLLRE